MIVFSVDVNILHISSNILVFSVSDLLSKIYSEKDKYIEDKNETRENIYIIK